MKKLLISVLVLFSANSVFAMSSENVKMVMDMVIEEECKNPYGSNYCLTYDQNSTTDPIIVDMAESWRIDDIFDRVGRFVFAPLGEFLNIRGTDYEYDYVRVDIFRPDYVDPKGLYDGVPEYKTCYLSIQSTGGNDPNSDTITVYSVYSPNCTSFGYGSHIRNAFHSTRTFNKK